MHRLSTASYMMGGWARGGEGGGETFGSMTTHTWIGLELICKYNSMERGDPTNKARSP